MASTTTETIRIDGMHCEHCANAVREALEGVEGAEVERVEVGEATVRLDPERTNRAALDQAIEDAGYTVAAPAS
jgi:copper chaperone CopZ